MITKNLKITIVVLLSIVALLFIVYSAFRGLEYITGEKYVTYLKQNYETVPFEDNFTYGIIDKDVEKNKFILVGEIHGFKEPTKFDYDFFKHLNSKFNIRKYIAEFDYVQSVNLNRFLDTGDEKFLDKALKNWVVIQGRNNQDYYNKYLNLYKYNKNLPENKKFKFIGIDGIQDIELTISYINELGKIDSTLTPIDNNSEILVIEKRIDNLLSKDITAKTKFELNTIQKNLEHLETNLNRDKVLFENFKDVYDFFALKNEKIYGYFGLFHVFKYKVNNFDDFASYVRKSKLGLENKILSISFSFIDSKMVMESSSLPSFIQPDSKYFKVPISYDNIIFMYIYGINDFKRITKEYSISIIKLNGKNSPYTNSNRMQLSFKILPFAGNLEFNEKRKLYFQYNIFIRNSDWAEPMK